MDYDWKAPIWVIVALIVLVAAGFGVVRWADAVDFMQANTNAGVGD